jgi:hypothetical protein
MARKSNLNAQRQAPQALVQGTIDTMTQGVSQQPPHLQQVGQGQEQINGWSSPVSGLQKRRGTVYVNKVSSTPLHDFYMETMPVGAGERYQVFIYKKGEKIRLTIRKNGQPVSIDVHGAGLSLVDGEVEGDASSYLWNTTELANSYVFFNNGPLGLLLNRERIVEMYATLSPSPDPEALIFIQSVAYEITYTVTLNGAALPSYKTPKATDTNNTISADIVAQELVKSINAVSPFRAVSINGVIYLNRSDKADFTISISDSRSNTLARAFKGSTTSFSGLPTIAHDGFLLRIENSPESTNDDYWVRFKTRDNAPSGEGSWIEAPAPGIPYELNPNTMPLVIYRKSTDVFFVGPADGLKYTIKSESFEFPKWGDRKTGNEITVPAPTFIGKPIKDHGIFQSRYVVLAGENVIMSKVDEVFDFFMQTSTQVLDTDPIDLISISEISSRLYWMLPIDESLLVFGAKSQFQVRPVSADTITPRNAVITRLSNIQMNVNLRPRLCGANVVFATDEYDFTGFREFQFYDQQSRRIGLNVGGNSSITINVPRYIPGYANKWDVGDSVDFFVCTTPSDATRLYVYKYLWANTASQLQKLQSSWSIWEFDAPIEWVRFIDNELWLVQTYEDGTYAVKIRPQEGIDQLRPYYHMDRKILYPECNERVPVVTATWNEALNITTFTLPYGVMVNTAVVSRYDNSRNQELQLGEAATGNKIVCTEHGDFRNDKLVIGGQYTFKYTFTNAYKPIADQARQRVIGDLSGRLQIATWTVFHTETGRYDVVVSRKGRAKNTRHQFWSRILNVESNRMDYSDGLLQRGTFRVPIYCRNTEVSVSIESQSWLPLTISGAAWEGVLSDRARSLR